MADENTLPAELEGKTPAEIAAYYAEREQTILSNARRMVSEAQQSAPPPPQEPVPPTPPNRTEPVTREEFNTVVSAAQHGLVAMAQQSASANKSDWSRLLPEIKKIVESMDVGLQIQASVWEEAYYNVRGRFTDTLVSEARNRALGIEQPSPAPPAPEPPRVFTADENRVIEGLNITHEMYAGAQKKLDANFQPFTTDNRRRA